ncbi:antibiotic biosynthesis monooxygenase [Streptomyces tailanensis]|uniref:antibiotic biosynthesis monooxygenase n=1 Tax=Streptomyces tailanensis TaxID=2569858 RepID=UPI00122E6F66|nr:antibiotic biosynthesis monooxygenase [Streptomyces tailanensis]
MISPAFPRIARSDVPLIVIGTRYAGGPDHQRRMADADAHEFDRGPWAGGRAVITWFLSMDGETLLTCAQWDSDAAYDAYLRGNGPATPLAGPPGYRLYRSLAEEGETRTPGCLITAAFDVDGPERQRYFTDAVIAAQPEEGGHPGAISAHFLLSTDGTRVLLYTEWTSTEAHQEAAEAGDHDKGHDIFSSTPGVRLTHGNRYHLHRALSRPLP